MEVGNGINLNSEQQGLKKPKPTGDQEWVKRDKTGFRRWKSPSLGPETRVAFG